MSADHDGDSRMASSPEDSDTDLATPAEQITNPAATILSPPDSQHRSQAMPTSMPGANVNGKRPIQTISNGADDDLGRLPATGATAMAAPAKAKQDFPPKTHKPSGYMWSRTEDEPGYAWLNKKAQDEHHRAWDSLVHKEVMVKNRYGDPFEAVEKEQAVLASLQQR